ncbi:MAG: hypothetical protein EON55_20210 [Alphaproteobacteria bacterium]|nr:MAG: hypothetical protein EON55_20210 [Alphaproteobacteria bacterium]
MRIWLYGVACLAGTLAAISFAKPGDDAAPPVVPALQRLGECRSIQAVEQRATCYDAAYDGFVQAQRSRQVVVIDRDEANKARRSLFGLDLPKLKIFSRGETRAEAQAFETLEAKIASVRQGGTGRWVMTLDDDSVWGQVDDEQQSSPPRAGDPVRIRKGAMGGYFANVAGRRAMRVRRVV